MIWEIHALKYAERKFRKRGDNFIADPHHSRSHPMHFYIWLLKSGDRTILVDTGYDLEEAKARAWPVLSPPAAMLSEFGHPPESIDDIILTHLHFDHAGSLKAFSRARLHVQAAEMAFATGPCICSEHMRIPFTGEHVCDMVRALYAGRVSFAEGSREIAPGVEVHLIGGHSRGLQCVRVATQRGWVVLASDASHFYENFLQRKPFPVVVDMEDVLRGFGRLKSLAESDAHIVPGHDPRVRELYPPTLSGSDRIVKLHAEPRKTAD